MRTICSYNTLTYPTQSTDDGFAAFALAADAQTQALSLLVTTTEARLDALILMLERPANYMNQVCRIHR